MCIICFNFNDESLEHLENIVDKLPIEKRLEWAKCFKVLYRYADTEAQRESIKQVQYLLSKYL